MNRGSRQRGAVVIAEQQASMRPRFMNRGSGVAALRYHTARARFNEAPIHESGKWAADLPPHRIRRRFNEAPIHESGKCDDGDGDQRGRRPASMRPRFMNRGSRMSRSAMGHRIPASMRPRFMNRGSLSGPGRKRRNAVRFNEAPIHESGKFSTSCDRAWRKIMLQ